MKSLSDYLNKLAFFVTGTCFLVMTVIIFIQIIFRYLFNHSLTWAEELSRFLFIWATILGISIGVKTNILLSITLLKENLPLNVKRLIEFVIQLVILCFALVMIIYGWEIAQKVHNQLSPAMRMPMSYVYIAVPISGALIIFHLVADGFGTLSKGGSHVNDSGH